MIVAQVFLEAMEGCHLFLSPFFVMQTRVFRVNPSTIVQIFVSPGCKDGLPLIWLPRPPSPSEPPSRLRRHLPLYSPPATPKILPHRVHPPTSLVPASSPCPPPEITSPTQPRPLPSKPELSHRLVSLHAKLQTPSGPNAFTLRLPVPSNLNIPEWRRRLTAYPDRVICEFLEFGWPVGYSSPSPPSSSSRNHGSARAQPNIVQSYLHQSHVRCRSHVRPLHVQPALHTPPPFLLSRSPWAAQANLSLSSTSASPEGHPLMTQFLKTRTSIPRYPFDFLASTPWSTSPSRKAPEACYSRRSSGTRTASFGSTLATTTFWVSNTSTPSTSMSLLRSVFAPPSWCANAQRQLSPSCFAPLVSTARTISTILAAPRFPSPPPPPFTHSATCSRPLACTESSPCKDCPPSTHMTFLGIALDTAAMTLSVTPDRLSELLDQCRSLLRVDSIPRRQLQSLLGVMSFVTACVRPARIFMFSLHTTLRSHSSDRCC